MSDPILTEPVAPVGTRRTIAHVNRGDAGSGFEEIEVPVYPADWLAEGRRVREVRHAVGLNLIVAAQRLGLKGPVEMSELERGRQRPVAPTTWEAIEEALRDG